MPVLNEVKMHRDHSTARFEHLMWLEDIERWRKEHQEARAMLTAAQAAWGKAEAALEDHAKEILLHEQHLRRHERIIHEHQSGEGGLRPDEFPAEHEELEAIHVYARQTHERLWEYHESVMTEIRELLKAALSGAVVPEV